MLPEAFTKITDALSDPYFLLSQSGNIISTNKAARKKFSLLNSSTNSLHLNALLTDEPERLKQLLKMWSRSQSPLPSRITFKAGEESIIQCMCKGSTIRPAMNGDSALIMVQCTDKKQSTAVFVTLNQKIELLKREISERRNAERKVRLLNQELEQRVDERTAELQQTNKELGRSLEELKSAQDHLVRTERLASLGGMVAGVAHEINTPIGVCVTASSFLEGQVNHYQNLYDQDALTRHGFEEFINVVSESSTIVILNLQRAADLVRSFKQLAVDQTSDERRVIDMKSYIEELLLSLQPYFKHTTHSYNIICQENIVIESFPGAIAQIINNLISNSMTHGLENIDNGKIKIEIKKDGDDIQLHYSDNGVGIPEQDKSKIFDPFFTTKRNQGGSGLGMNIVYNLVTSKLGGNINITKEESKGVHFHITIPGTAKK